MTNSESKGSAKLDQILEVLVRLASGDMHARAPEPDGDDPIDLVTTAINMLAEELAAVIAEQQTARESLEARVRERTAELTRELEERKQAELLIEKQSAAIRELSTPTFEVWSGVLVLPLIGTVDTARGQQVTESLLEAIVELQASVAIIDVTGVPVVDTSVADHLLKTIQAARMLGAEVILTGVSPHNAQTLVGLGVDLDKVTTQGSLQAGLKLSLQRTNRQIVPVTRDR